MESTWDQRLSLKPPRYTGALSAYLSGIHIGDPIVDAMGSSELLCHGLKKSVEMKAEILETPEPDWVDWDQVRRGQKTWMKHLGRNFFALGNALVIGFSIGRFAEVLSASGEYD